jgi:FkbM family methyltransferase
MKINIIARISKNKKIQTKILEFCKNYIKKYDKIDYNQNTNGEKFIVKKLSTHGHLSLCFDVGANKGDWAAMVLEENPSAIIHCFEISPLTFTRLKERHSSNKQIILNNLGLSNQSGDGILQQCLDDDGWSSIVEVVNSKNTEILPVKVYRGGDYLKNNKITKIDFLKIDVEGAENLVLDGLDEFLNPKFIPIIQFEYGRVNIASKFLLSDFYKLFKEKGYKIGKLTPQGVLFKEYAYEDEDFMGPNFIAASHELVDYIKIKNL